jgi:shikimate dehydrogenase
MRASTKICLSLFGTTEEIMDAINSSDADLFEIRLDLSGELDGPKLRAATHKPLLFTAHRRPDLLEHFWPFADYVDVEQAEATGRNTIRSIHAADEDPDRLWEKLSGEHMTKIVLETANYKIISRLIQMNRIHAPLAICFAAGEIGTFSRIISVLNGARWIYASLPGRATAPGQFALDELLHTYRMRRFEQNQDIAVFGIIGNPVSQSHSPRIQNEKFTNASLPWIYLPFLCKNLTELFEAAPSWNAKGFSITHPWKEKVMDVLDSASPDVLMLRSCNTVAYAQGKWHGINTDVEGIRAMLRDVPIAGKRVLILGAGASSRALAMVIRPVANSLVILNRTAEKADDTLAAFSNYDYDVLINATPVGWNEPECPVNPDVLRPGKIVIDAIYQETELLKRARSIGCRTMDGRVWFETQADAQFDYWKSQFSSQM